MAPRASGAMRLRVPAATRIVPGGAAGRPRASAAVAVAAGIVAAARETDVELLELAVQMGALEARLVGDAAHVALLATEELLEVDPLEGLARLAQRQLEEARRDLGRGLRIGRRGLAQHALDVLRRDLAPHEREVLDEACEVVEVPRPIRIGERGER